MKKAITGIFILILTVCIVGCSTTTKKPRMYIEEAQLTEQEESIVELLGANTGQVIYDFKLDKNVKSMQVNTYRLIDGTWAPITGGGGESFLDSKGRIAFDFENLAEGLRIGLQSEHSGNSTKYSIEPEEKFSQMTRSTSTLNDITEISYEQEIPLVIQISTSQDIIKTNGVKDFFAPEEYVNNGYEHVYAITILFSEKTVQELDIREWANKSNVLTVFCISFEDI